MFRRFVKQTSFVKKLDFLIKIFTVIGALVILILDFGFYISDSHLLSIILFLLTILISGNVIEYVDSINPTNIELSSRNNIEYTYSLKDRFENAKTVHVAAIANKGLWTGRFRDEVIRSMNNNVNFEFISIDPCGKNDPNFKVFINEFLKNSVLDANNSEDEANFILQSPIRSYQLFIEENKNLKKNIEYRLCNFVLPYALMLIEYKDGSRSVKIDMYDYKVCDGERRSFIVHSKKDPDLIDFYENQWKKLWGKSVTISCEGEINESN